MLNLSFLSNEILLEGWSFVDVSPWQMKSCEARYVQDKRVLLSNAFASGLRSENSNHSWWLTLAGSSCNWLQRCIRNLTTSLYWAQRLQRMQEGYGVGLVLELTVMIGWNANGCMLALELTSQRIRFECNSIQTTLRLSWTKQVRDPFYKGGM